MPPQTHLHPLTHIQQVTKEGYKPVVTQIYPKDDPWLSTDTVFAVKDDLVVDFKPLSGVPEKMGEHKGYGGPATKELELDIVLAPQGLAATADDSVQQKN